MKRWLEYVSIAIISLILGFYTSSYTFFKFDDEINIIDLLTLLISSLLGVYIATTLQKKVSDDKYEKDLLLSEITQAKSDFKNIYNAVLNDQINFNETVYAFKVISSNLSNLNLLFDVCKIKDKRKISDVIRQARLLKQIVTNSSVTNNLIILDSISKNHFFLEYNRLSILLLELIVETNRNR